MIINIGNKYRIKSDSVQWTAQEYGGKDKKGKDTWTNLGYYTDFSACLRGLTERRIRLVDSDVPEKILDAIETIKRESQYAARTFTIEPRETN